MADDRRELRKLASLVGNGDGLDVVHVTFLAVKNRSNIHTKRDQDGTEVLLVPVTLENPIDHLFL